MWHVHVPENHKAMEIKKLQLHSATWVNLRNNVKWKKL